MNPSEYYKLINQFIGYELIRNNELNEAYKPKVGYLKKKLSNLNLTNRGLGSKLDQRA